jgi:hypothetical protein
MYQRELKFRVYAVNNEFPNGKLYYCDKSMFLINLSGNLVEVFPIEYPLGRYDMCFARIGYSGIVISQYTGFKDSNEKEIYEGDIFESLDYKWDPVKFENGKFVVNLQGARLHDLCELFDGADKPTVIGNIFENPELLKIENE